MFPYQLSPHYPYFIVPESGSATIAVMVFSLFFGISVAVVLAWHKQKRAWMIAWLFYLLTLLPVLGLIQVGTQGAADRYTYFPTLPIYLLLAGGIFSLMKGDKAYKKALLRGAFALIFIFMAQTRKQIGIWQSDLSVWTQAVNVYPHNNLALDNLGIEYMNIGDYENAAIQFESRGKFDASGKSQLERSLGED